MRRRQIKAYKESGRRVKGLVLGLWFVKCLEMIRQ